MRRRNLMSCKYKMPAPSWLSIKNILGTSSLPGRAYREFYLTIYSESTMVKRTHCLAARNLKYHARCNHQMNKLSESTSQLVYFIVRCHDSSVTFDYLHAKQKKENERKVIREKQYQWGADGEFRSWSFNLHVDIWGLGGQIATV